MEEAVSLPASEPKDQVRPGLTAKISVDSKTLTVLTVHLKSSCVSPLENMASNPDKGKLEKSDPHCQILQKQVKPLESWIEAQSADGAFVMLGDFNRNLHHEMNSIAPDQIRVDGSDAKTALPDGVLVRSLMGELNDGEPVHSAMTLAPSECVLSAELQAICERAKIEALSRDELKPLTRSDGLGCRNPVGLDHVLLGSGVAIDGKASKVPLGKLGGTRPASGEFPNPLLALSDHCPMIAKVKF
ncbi:MAG: endonuclease/exonuclease/phosphatase family protein [Aestuariivirga sp.]